ncbi:hypothetical protein BDP81DRAFT_83347 [Colletotrichum phormii]|uniref:Uncharacterized protein n=1 Tax=Colletotrichum phormii TaxID=359342 RepID=A0AAJ0A1N0_9PEZI|nr:uncharacterized protein BDP81DRAFT_83347 [Colletotrichum phormii]KAK1654434.1 hypothetical protein BDP81DRAFT_83347 [Colletotrichum phormii]
MNRQCLPLASPVLVLGLDSCYQGRGIGRVTACCLPTYPCNSPNPTGQPSHTLIMSPSSTRLRSLLAVIGNSFSFFFTDENKSSTTERFFAQDMPRLGPVLATAGRPQRISSTALCVSKAASRPVLKTGTWVLKPARIVKWARCKHYHADSDAFRRLRQSLVTTRWYEACRVWRRSMLPVTCERRAKTQQ